LLWILVIFMSVEAKTNQDTKEEESIESPIGALWYTGDTGYG
jgi:hypothetical protein